VDHEHTVSEMANEVLVRQAKARAKQTGETLEEALETVLEPRPEASCAAFKKGRTATRRRTSGRKESLANGPRSAPTRAIDVHQPESQLGCRLR
jgi:hypothetical protein